jgi:Protein of unknown function (DUF3040)
MSLTPAEQRALARIEDSLRRSDPGLAAMLATFTPPGFGAKVAARVRPSRRMMWVRPLMLAVIALIAICVICIGALLQGGGGPLCPPGLGVIAGGQTLSCPPVGPPGYQGPPAGKGGIGRLPAGPGHPGDDQPLLMTSGPAAGNGPARSRRLPRPGR